MLPAIGLMAEFLLRAPHGFELHLGEPLVALAFMLPLIFSVAFFLFGRREEMLRLRLSAGQVIERELLHLSLHDRLTGLPNRASLEREIERFVRARRRGRSRPAFLLLDLDKFKHVNDTLGHDAGDELLQLFAARMSGAVGAQARIFRLGGDEFVMTVAGMPDNGDVERLCHAIEARASEPFDLAAGRAVIGVSIGIAHFEADDHAMADVMKRADLALYAAKDIAGSSHVFHDRALARDMQERMRMEQDIAAGLLREEFFVEYQPVVSATTREIAAFEALVRWRHPRLGILGPEHFLAVAERSGHLLALGRFVIARAIEEAARWPESIGVAVNVTGDEFRDRQLVRYVETMLDIHQVAPRRLTIEITEAAFTVDTAVIRKSLADLSKLGVKIAIDDFGMGFSSINHLRQFPIDRLKIDRSFTQAMLQGGRETELVEIILRLGHVFGISTTVEGVENEDQLAVARALGAAEVQGFLISRPIPAGAANALAYGEPDLLKDAALRFSA
ncbi:MAG: EAL domain-containing protein [Rhizobium sp.]|nr:EAL domain-containing protein [Rhizobium sp.]